MTFCALSIFVDIYRQTIDIYRHNIDISPALAVTYQTLPEPFNICNIFYPIPSLFTGYLERNLNKVAAQSSSSLAAKT